MIKLENVSFSYDENKALSLINLEIKEGETLAIIGHNGSGKSTLAKLFNGLLLPSSGQVLVEGLNTADEDKLLAIRQRVGMVFQNPDNQLVTTIVEEDVAFGPCSLGIPTDEVRLRVDESLSSVKMQDYALSAPHMLSGGQKQRVAIAGVLAMRPKVLIMDEATSMLDPVGRRDVLEIVKRLNQELGMTVVIITQLMEEALMCDRVAVLYKGELAELDTPENIFDPKGKLTTYGLEFPAIPSLAAELVEAGLPIRGNPMSVCELADELERIAASLKG